MQMLARIKLRTIRHVSTEITATYFKLQKISPMLPEYLKQYFLFSSGLKQISYKSFEESEINSTEKVVPFQNAIIFGIRKLWHSALTFHIQPAETHIRMPELSAPEKNLLHIRSTPSLQLQLQCVQCVHTKRKALRRLSSQSVLKCARLDRMAKEVIVKLKNDQGFPALPKISDRS